MNLINPELVAMALDRVKSAFIPVGGGPGGGPMDPAVTGAPVQGPPQDPAAMDPQMQQAIMQQMMAGGGGGQPQPAPQQAEGQPAATMSAPGNPEQQVSMTIDQLTRFVAAISGKGLPDDKNKIKQLETQLAEYQQRLGVPTPGTDPNGAQPGAQPQDPNQTGTIAEMKAAETGESLTDAVRAALDEILKQ